jgi:hypothetical protein
MARGCGHPSIEPLRKYWVPEAMVLGYWMTKECRAVVISEASEASSWLGAAPAKSREKLIVGSYLRCERQLLHTRRPTFASLSSCQMPSIILRLAAGGRLTSSPAGSTQRHQPERRFAAGGQRPHHRAYVELMESDYRT